ncbi:MAG: hypothetical protein ACI9JR_001817 [Gammaproteobacteria bacterium]
MLLTKRALLSRLIKYFIGISVFALLFVLMDFSIDFRPKNVQASYHFTITDSEITFDKPVWLRQDNLSILLIKRSLNLRHQLSNTKNSLQDIDSDSSRQPSYATNALRSRDEKYFVSYAIGTDLTCPLELKENQTLQEICGTASYDFAGRALSGHKQFQNLPIPDYNFNHDFSGLTISIY